jgi:DNA-binding MarR family transcriptional regulator
VPITIEDSYYYKLHILKSVSDNLFDQRLRFEVGVGLTHFVLLATIHRFQPVSHQQIASFLDITPGAISRQIEIARAKGWITTKDDAADRRKSLVLLTPEGKRIFEAGDAQLTELGRHILGDIDELRVFVAQLETIKERLDKISPQV